MVSFTPRPLYPRGKCLRYPLNTRLGGPHSRYEHDGEEKCLPRRESNHDSPALHPIGWIKGLSVQILTVVIFQIVIFWIVTPYSIVDGYRLFGGTCCCVHSRDIRLQDYTQKTTVWGKGVPKYEDGFFSSGMLLLSSISIIILLYSCPWLDQGTDEHIFSRRFWRVLTMVYNTWNCCLLDFIIPCSEERQRTRRFQNRICFRPQVKGSSDWG
jgi:hypothetical protein